MLPHVNQDLTEMGSLAIALKYENEKVTSSLSHFQVLAFLLSVGGPLLPFLTAP